MRRLVRSIATMAAIGFALAPPLAAQEAATDTMDLSLPDAAALALGESEEILLARSQVALAGVQVASARSAVLPQVNASFGYTRTLASIFSGASTPALPDSMRFDPDPSLPLEQRVAYLE